MKLNSLEQERETEKRLLGNKTEVLEKKYNETQSELEQLERNIDEERIGYVKKIEGLNFDLSRKEKDLLQLNAKNESLQQAFTKKEAQVEAVKNLMNQEIQSSLKKVSEIQTKYQKLNEEHMQYRINSEK